MNAYMTMANALAVNPSMLSLEGLIWNCSLLRSILLDLNLVDEKHLGGNNLNRLQKLAMARKSVFSVTKITNYRCK